MGKRFTISRKLLASAALVAAAAAALPQSASAGTIHDSSDRITGQGFGAAPPLLVIDEEAQAFLNSTVFGLPNFIELMIALETTISGAAGGPEGFQAVNVRQSGSTGSTGSTGGNNGSSGGNNGSSGGNNGSSGGNNGSSGGSTGSTGGTPIPAPAGLWLFAAGLGLIGWRFGKKRAA